MKRNASFSHSTPTLTRLGGQIGSSNLIDVDIPGISQSQTLLPIGMSRYRNESISSLRSVTSQGSSGSKSVIIPLTPTMTRYLEGTEELCDDEIEIPPIPTEKSCKPSQKVSKKSGAFKYLKHQFKKIDKSTKVGVGTKE